MATMKQLRTDTLLGLFHERKAALDAAKAALDEVSEEIAFRANTTMGGALEGSTTWQEGGFKATVLFALNRKLDHEKLKADWSKLRSGVCAVLGWKAELKVGEFRKLDAESAAQLQEYIVETKPAKPQVKVVSVQPGN